MPLVALAEPAAALDHMHTSGDVIKIKEAIWLDKQASRGEVGCCGEDLVRVAHSTSTRASIGSVATS